MLASCRNHFLFFFLFLQLEGLGSGGASSQLGEDIGLTMGSREVSKSALLPLQQDPFEAAEPYSCPGPQGYKNFSPTLTWLHLSHQAGHQPSTLTLIFFP